MDILTLLEMPVASRDYLSLLRYVEDRLMKDLLLVRTKIDKEEKRILDQQNSKDEY